MQYAKIDSSKKLMKKSLMKKSQNILEYQKKYEKA